jgi:hypothetical protein
VVNPNSFGKKRASGQPAVNPFLRQTGLLSPNAIKEKEWENKVEFGGVFFATHLARVNAPHLPRISPQIDHQNTTF